MAQREKDGLSTLRANERARGKEEAARTRRTADLARRREQAPASHYLTEEEALKKGYEVPSSDFRGVFSQGPLGDNRGDDRNDSDGAVYRDDVSDADALDLRVARREEMLRGVPIGGIAGNAQNVAYSGHDVVAGGAAGYRRLWEENAGRGNGATFGQMPVNGVESSS